jgi:hypothetical protein
VLEPWLCAAKTNGCPELRGIAQGLRRNCAAMDAGRSLAWIQVQTEEKVNKIKTTRCTM